MHFRWSLRLFLLIAAFSAARCSAAPAVQRVRQPQGNLQPVLRATLQGHRKQITGVAFHGQNLVASCDLAGVAILWDPVTRAPDIERKIGEEAHGVVFDQAGSVMVGCSKSPWTGNWSGKLFAVDMATANQVEIPAAEPHAFSCLAMNPGGDIVACGAHTTLRVWDLKSLVLVKKPGPRRQVQQKLLEVTPAAPAFPGEITALDVCQKNLAVAVGCQNGSITLASVGRDGVKKLPTKLGRHAQKVTGLAFSADGRVLVSSSLDPLGVAIWDPKTGKQLPGGGGGPALSACIAPDGAFAATGHPDGMVRVWDTKTGGQVTEIPTGDTAVHAIAFNSNGRRLVTGGRDFQVRIWDLYAAK